MTRTNKLFGCSRSIRLVGDPVDVVTGATTDINCDFILAGPLPFEWRRHYNSGHNRASCSLGWGHAHEYERTLRFDIDGMRYTAAIDKSIMFPILEKDGDQSAKDGFILKRLSSSLFHVFEHPHSTMEFKFNNLHSPALLKRVIKEPFSIDFEYSSSGHLKTVIDSLNRSIQIEHDDTGRIHSLILQETKKGDKILPLSTYRYDGNGNLKEGLDSQGYAIRFEYDQNNRMISKLDRSGYTFYFKYNRDGRCVHSYGEDGLHEVRLNYMILERTTIVTQACGGEWTYLYDESGNINQIIDPYGGTRNFILDGKGRVTEEHDPNGNVTSWIYGPSGEPVCQGIASESYLPNSRDDTKIVPYEHRIPNCPSEWEYGKLIDLSTIQRSESTHENLPSYRETNLKPAKSGDTADDDHFYNDFGFLLREIVCAGHIRSWTYDANGNIKEYTDSDNSKYTYDYSSWNLLHCETDPLNRKSFFEYMPNEKISEVVDPSGNRSEFKYDLKNRLIEIRRHGNIKDQYRFDNGDNLIEKCDAEGNILLSLKIGRKNLLTERKLTSGENHYLDYDDNNQLIRATTNDLDIKFYYSDESVRIGEKRNGTGIICSDFDVRPLIKMNLFDKFTISYHYNCRNEVMIEDPGGGTQKISIMDNVVQRRLSNGTLESTKYNKNGICLRKTIDRNHHYKPKWHRHYKYSGEGDLLTVRDNIFGNTEYRYDAAHRLSHVIDSKGHEQPFGYDASDNILNQPGLANVHIGEGNRLATANGLHYEYNVRNAIKLKKGSGDLVRYFYDSRDFLTRIETNGFSWKAQYDPLGRRMYKSSGDDHVEYYWDNNRVTAEIKNDGAVLIYIYPDSLAIVPFMFIEYKNLQASPETGKRYFIFCNHMGTPILAEDENSEVVWNAHIDPYGLAHIDPKSSIDIPFRFPGHYHDTETGLHYNRFRYYSPELGRYLQSDPAGSIITDLGGEDCPDSERIEIGSNLNLYKYTNNPLKEVDIRGLGCPRNRRRIQPDDLGPDKLGYFRWPDQIWKWFNRESAPRKGWKIHISASPDDAYIVVRSVTEKLRAMGEAGISHKVAPDTETYRNLGNQRGKLITIYCEDADSAQRVLNTIDPELTSLRENGGIQPGPTPTTRQSGHTETETPVGNSGMTSTYPYDETGE